MKLFLVILMLLPGLNYGFLTPSDTICKAINDTTCTVTLGGSVFLQVMNNASGYRIHFSRGSKEIFKIKRGTLEVHEDAFRNRTEAFMDSGTIKIQNVQWEDAGQYIVEIYNTDGRNLKTVQVTLEVKANPWPVVVYAGTSVGVFLLLVFISCCIYRKVKKRKQKKGGNSVNHWFTTGPIPL